METRLLCPFPRNMAFLPGEIPMLVQDWSAVGYSLELMARYVVGKSMSDRFQEYKEPSIAAVRNCLVVFELFVIARSRPAVQASPHL